MCASGKLSGFRGPYTRDAAGTFPCSECIFGTPYPAPPLPYRAAAVAFGAVVVLLAAWITARHNAHALEIL